MLRPLRARSVSAVLVLAALTLLTAACGGGDETAASANPTALPKSWRPAGVTGKNLASVVAFRPVAGLCRGTASGDQISPDQLSGITGLVRLESRGWRKPGSTSPTDTDIWVGANVLEFDSLAAAKTHLGTLTSDTTKISAIEAPADVPGALAWLELGSDQRHVVFLRGRYFVEVIVGSSDAEVSAREVDRVATTLDGRLLRGGTDAPADFC